MKTKKLSEKAIEALSEAVVLNNRIVRFPQQLDRDVYVEVNKALEALGGKWSRNDMGHVWKEPCMPKKLIEDLLDVESYVDKKQELGFFETPDEIADLLVRLANIEPGNMVLEPSAGRGRLLHAMARATKQISVTGIEIDQQNFDVLGAECQLFTSATFVREDFLKVKVTDTVIPYTFFNRIVMNPPFAKHADIEHVLHAWEFLAPGGRLVSVMSSHCTFANDATCHAFRAFVKEHSVTAPFMKQGCVVTLFDGAPFFPLPLKTFAASGTNVSTVVIVLKKPQ